MNNYTYGEIDWVDGGTSSNKKQDLEYSRFEQGSNTIRIIARPRKYLMHKPKFGSKDKYGQTLHCMVDNCILCKNGDKPKQRWLLPIINRAKNRIEVFDFGPAVFEQIRKLSQSPAWGNPADYDLELIVDKNAPAINYYKVNPIPKKPLSAHDVQLVTDYDLSVLDNKVIPWDEQRMLNTIESCKKKFGFDLLASFQKEEDTNDESDSNDFDDFEQFE